MNIYKAERDIPGLAEKIQANCSIAYTSQLKEIDENLRQSLQAHVNIDDVLFHTESILVTTNWNKNDDVFDPRRTWAARKTPMHKPTNEEHDENRMVGHIISVWAIDQDGKVIPDETKLDDLPNIYHLCNGAVIYKSDIFKDQENKDRIDTLIEQIQAGKKYVSMECLFAGFDYAVVDDLGNSYVIARNEESAFLTKHLRAYGGSGMYEGHKIGRLLSNIVFSGKGYVDNPANPNSIIFSDSEFNFVTAKAENPFLENSGVYKSYDNKTFNKGSIQMSSENLLVDQNKQLKADLEAALAEVKEANKKLAEAGIKEYESKITDLNSQIETLTQTVAELTEGADASRKTTEELVAKVEALEAEKKTLEDKIQEAEAAEAKANRVSKLVDGGVDKTVAEEKVETFANLSDEQFDSIAVDIIAAHKPVETEATEGSETTETETESEETDDAEANADTEALENAETDDEVEPSVAGTNEEVDKAEEARANLQKFVASRLHYAHTNEENE